MGTRCHVVLPGSDSESAEQIFRVIKRELLRIEQDLSRFISDSEISCINKLAAQNPVPVSDQVFEILKICKKYYNITGGAFDITLRPLLEYWKDKPGDYSPNGEVTRLMETVGMQHVLLDETNQTVSFDNGNIQIDLGGFGKGYALERISRQLSKFSVESGFISFGESSILTVGNHPAGDHWKIGMKNYLNPEESVHTFLVRYGSVSTSSNFFVDDNGRLRNHRHVIDPFQGYPTEELKSVSVCSESPVLAEVMSTAMLVSTDEHI